MGYCGLSSRWFLLDLCGEYLQVLGLEIWVCSLLHSGLHGLFRVLVLGFFMFALRFSSGWVGLGRLGGR